MAELAHERERVEQEIAIARMEAEQEALPKSFMESLEINKGLREQLGALAVSFQKANSRGSKRKERAIGFALGVAASLSAAVIWWFVTGLWPILKS